MSNPSEWRELGYDEDEIEDKYYKRENIQNLKEKRRRNKENNRNLKRVIKNDEVSIGELDPHTIHPTTVNDENGGSKLVAIGKPGCFEKGTKVRMFDGTSKDVEDIIIGDVLMGDDSTPRNVLDLCFGIDHMYTIIPHTNTIKSYTVNYSHILSLINTSYKEIIPDDIMLSKFIENYSDNIKIYSGYKRNVVFPVYIPFSFSFKNLLKLVYRSGLNYVTSDITIPLYVSHNCSFIRLLFLSALLKICYFKENRMDIFFKTKNKVVELSQLCSSLGYRTEIIDHSKTGYYRLVVFDFNSVT